jgi:hypothetical protein
MSDYRLAEDRQQVSREVSMAADGSNHGGQCGIIGNPQGGGFASVANGGRITVAEVGTDGGEAETGMQTGQVHGQVAGLHDGSLPARAAKGSPPHAELGTDNPGDLLDREPSDGECGILGQEPSHGGKIKRWRGARSRRFQAWTTLAGASPASRPHFQGKAAKPAIQSSVTISGLCQRFNGLSRERQASGTGSFMQVAPT